MPGTVLASVRLVTGQSTGGTVLSHLPALLWPDGTRYEGEEVVVPVEEQEEGDQDMTSMSTLVPVGVVSLEQVPVGVASLEQVMSGEGDASRVVASNKLTEWLRI